MSVLAFFSRENREQALEQFLAAAELRAYQTAHLTTKREADALDIVQDAMLQLVQHYREHTPEEWPKLFQRILQHRIVDWVRFQYRQRGMLQAFNPDETEEDPLNNFADPRDVNPLALAIAQEDLSRIMHALEELPLRQRQCFLLRAWEGFDTQSTAQALGISSGSVKTHYSRSLEKLAKAINIEPLKEPNYAL
jgi:RNA polymerase sigma-70 factor, ECF subfamily